MIFLWELYRKEHRNALLAVAISRAEKAEKELSKTQKELSKTQEELNRVKERLNAMEETDIDKSLNP